MGFNSGFKGLKGQFATTQILSLPHSLPSSICISVRHIFTSQTEKRKKRSPIKPGVDKNASKFI